MPPVVSWNVGDLATNLHTASSQKCDNYQKICFCNVQRGINIFIGISELLSSELMQMVPRVSGESGWNVHLITNSKNRSYNKGYIPWGLHWILSKNLEATSIHNLLSKRWASDHRVRVTLPMVKMAWPSCPVSFQKNDLGNHIHAPQMVHGSLVLECEGELKWLVTARSSRPRQTDHKCPAKRRQVYAYSRWWKVGHIRNTGYSRWS